MFGATIYGTTPYGALPRRDLRLQVVTGSFVVTGQAAAVLRIWPPLDADGASLTVTGRPADVYLVGFSRPNADLARGGWLNNAGGAELFSAIDEADASDLDFIQSPALDDAETDTCELALQDVNNPGVDYGHRIGVRFRKVNVAGTQVANFTVQLVQGATVIAGKTYSNVGTGWITDEWEMTPAQAAAITNYDDLRIRFVAAA